MYIAVSWVLKASILITSSSCENCVRIALTLWADLGEEELRECVEGPKVVLWSGSHKPGLKLLAELHPFLEPRGSLPSSLGVERTPFLAPVGQKPLFYWHLTGQGPLTALKGCSQLLSTWPLPGAILGFKMTHDPNRAQFLLGFLD